MTNPLAIIGGTGLYNMDGLENAVAKDFTTPFGKPSAALTFATLLGKEVVFLPRHGNNHELLPHEVNYRANIHALKQAGALQAVSISACGSLREEIKMGHFIVPDQYFDHTKGRREATFFGNGLTAHVSTAKPACPALASALAAAARATGAHVHTGKTFAVIEGPRLGTQAESHFLRGAANADIVGMTNIPEVFLAREAQLCYASLAIATDYDCWMEDPARHATVTQVIAAYGESIERAQRVLCELVKAGTPPVDNTYRRALDSAMFTSDDKLTKQHLELLAVLRR